MSIVKLKNVNRKRSIVKTQLGLTKKMLIEVWHENHDYMEILNFVPQIGSLLHFDDESEFVKASKFNGFEVVGVSYWLSQKNNNDECAVTVKNAIIE